MVWVGLLYDCDIIKQNELERRYVRKVLVCEIGVEGSLWDLTPVQYESLKPFMGGFIFGLVCSSIFWASFGSCHYWASLFQHFVNKFCFLQGIL